MFGKCCAFGEFSEPFLYVMVCVYLPYANVTLFDQGNILQGDRVFI